jgi:hypothetical protein
MKRIFALGILWGGVTYFFQKTLHCDTEMPQNIISKIEIASHQCCNAMTHNAPSSGQTESQQF